MTTDQGWTLFGQRKRWLARSTLSVACAGALAAAGPVAGSPLLPGAASARAGRAMLAGRVLSAGRPVASMQVDLYRTPSRAGGRPILLGWSRSHADGSFRIRYPRQRRSGAVLYVLAGPGAAVRLATVIGHAPAPNRLVVNERTTVAMGFAMAQFISDRGVAGKAPGLQNAAAMAGDLVDLRTGGLSGVLSSKPNGSQTSTLRTFNSLANMLVPCARSSRDCRRLYALAKPARGPAPRNTLEAVADIARNPAHNVNRLFVLARSGPLHYRPALGASSRPDAWIVALRFYGDGKELNGPGNMAIDAHGNVWVTSNYTYSRNPLAPVCGSELLFKFTPTGRYAPGSPYMGGGLNGAGFGITFDPKGNVWVGNYGFSSTRCPAQDQPPHDSVSEFRPDGTPLSPSAPATNPGGGFTQGPLSYPQGTVSDRGGTIWMANACNDTITRYPGGNPGSFVTRGAGIQAPFDIALNLRGQAFVTGNHSSTVAMLNPDGSAASNSPIAGGGLSAPLGIAADSRGDMWVANSGTVAIPCPSGGGTVSGQPSVTLIDSSGVPRATPFTGGGLTLPWGIAVDGHDNVWVANFGKQRVTELCGIQPANCPPRVRTGQAISPDGTGYGFDGLTRNTGIQIDPSGNVWIANNWKNLPIPNANPGGYEMVVYVGVAGPLKTPLIGPPQAP